MRAIDADALQLAIVEEGQANKRKEYIIGDIWELTGAEIRDVINSQPTIQPEPKRGKWIRTGSGSLYDHYECSECGKAPKWECMGDNRWKIAFTDFCPNCGAKMEVTNGN